MIEKIVDTNEILKDKPRPHYLVGKAVFQYDEAKNLYLVKAEAIFPSSQASIADRMKGEIPHVNVGDAYFGVWNAAHIFAHEEHYKNTLALEGKYRAKNIIIADMPINLELTLSNLRKFKDRSFITYGAKYSLDNQTLLTFNGVGTCIYESNK